MAAQFDSAFELYVDLTKYVDVAEELRRIAKTIEKTEKEVASHEQGLSNPAFVDKAPPEKVEEKRQALAQSKERLAKLRESEADLRSVSGS